MVQKILATKDIIVKIEGVEYDCLLMPRQQVVDVEYPLPSSEDSKQEEE